MVNLLNKAEKISCWEDIASSQAEILAIGYKHSLTCQNHTEALENIRKQYATTIAYLKILKK